MHRERLLSRLLGSREPWDVLVVGGGATGLGTAVDAAARGYRTALVEAIDFAKGTSSRSTKLVHGGVRYLRQGNLGLVVEALRERGRLLANAPHLVHNLSFVMPSYEWWEGPFYGAGLKVYDLLAGRLGLGPSRRLSRPEVLELLPTLEPAGLRGGVVYHDAQFDDARLAVTLARTLDDLGGAPVNGMEVVGLLKARGLVAGVAARDAESGQVHEIPARAVVNATGVFADELRRLDDPASRPLLSPSQGVHLVLDRAFLPGASAILVPHTEDGRVLFAVPWHGRVVIGTTDTPVGRAEHEPRPLPVEIDYLLTHAARLLTRHPRPADVLSCFAGLRPLLAPADAARPAAETAALARDHAIVVSRSGLVTVAGGKWTTYRQMGEDTVDQVALLAGLEERPSPTATLRLHGAMGSGRPGEPAPEEEAPAGGSVAEPAPVGVGRAGGAAAGAAAAAGATTGRSMEPDWTVYGSDAPALAQLAAERPEWSEPLHPALPYRVVEVIWAVRHEMARTVDDVLARRTRALLLDARVSAEIAPQVAALLAGELGRDAGWQRREVESFRTLARGYWL
jgi:glycerol-3-phosphate dehydrogenase